jgi:hypothetical protein
LLVEYVAFLRSQSCILGVAMSKEIENKEPPYSITPVTCEESIAAYPAKLELADLLKNKSLTLGDLHGNTLKLLWHLVKNGLVSLSEESYKKFVELYNKGPTKDYTAFDNILTEMKVKAPEGFLLRFIGDTLADRGQDDTFTFKLLDKLRENGLKTEESISNHNLEMICQYEGVVLALNQGIDRGGQANSLKQLKSTFDTPQMKEWMTRHYSTLNLISYEVGVDPEGKKNIHIFPHAPIYPVTIQKAAEELEIKVDEINNVEELAILLDTMNTKFRDILLRDRGDIQKKALLKKKMLIPEQLLDMKNPPPPPALNQIVWQRVEDIQIIEKKDALGKISKDINISITHGHDTNDFLKKYGGTWDYAGVYKEMNNIDNSRGKSMDTKYQKNEETVIVSENRGKSSCDFINIEKKEVKKEEPKKVESLIPKVETKKVENKVDLIALLNESILSLRSAKNYKSLSYQPSLSDDDVSTRKTNISHGYNKTSLELNFDKEMNVNFVWTLKGKESAQEQQILKEFVLAAIADSKKLSNEQRDALKSSINLSVKEEHKKLEIKGEEPKKIETKIETNIQTVETKQEVKKEEPKKVEQPEGKLPEGTQFPQGQQFSWDEQAWANWPKENPKKSNVSSEKENNVGHFFDGIDDTLKKIPETSKKSEEIRIIVNANVKKPPNQNQIPVTLAYQKITLKNITQAEIGAALSKLGCTEKRNDDQSITHTYPETKAELTVHKEKLTETKEEKFVSTNISWKPSKENNDFALGLIAAALKDPNVSIVVDEKSAARIAKLLIDAGQATDKLYVTDASGAEKPYNSPVKPLSEKQNDSSFTLKPK